MEYPILEDAKNKYNNKRIALNKNEFSESLGLCKPLNSMTLLASPVGHGKTSFLLQSFMKDNADVKIGFFTTTSTYTFIEKMAIESLFNKLHYNVGRLCAFSYAALSLPSLNDIKTSVVEYNLGLVIIDNYISPKLNFFCPNIQYLSDLKCLANELGFNILFTHSVDKAILHVYPNKVPEFTEFIEDSRIFQIMDSIIWTENFVEFDYEEFENGLQTNEYKRLSYLKSIEGKKEPSYVKLFL